MDNPKVEHIDYALVAKTHPSMYLMHQYWARKPHNVVAEYIKHYSKEGDIVLDSFSGSGVTAIEALRLGRKAIAIDLDPMATFMTKMTCIPIDLKELENAFKEIENKIKDKINSLYKTKCPHCKKDSIIEYTLWEEETPIRINFYCEQCSRESEKGPDKEDYAKISEIEKMKIPFWYPTNELIWNTRVNIHKGTHVYDLFSKRNLLALSMLYDEIEKIESSTIKDLMKFVFTSGLHSASKMKILKAGWTIRGYWIGKQHLEQNVYLCFERRYKKILNGKEESNKLIGKHYKEAKKFEDLLEDKTILISTQSALNLSNIPNNSIDYIFTDPPYGDSVPYLELDYMWSSWLKFKPDFEDEVIISDSPIRKNKKLEEYNRMLIQAFKECFRVLKPNHWMTVTFHNTDIEIYNSIIRDIIFAGFMLDKILYQPPAKISGKALLAPYGSAVGDYYIRFLKPEAPRKILTDKQIDMMHFEKIVIEAVKKIIAERGEPITYNDILKSIYIELDKQGYLLSAKSEDIQEILNKYKDKEFVFLRGQGWWFKKPEKYLLDIIPLEDRVEQVVIQTLRRKYKASFDDILQEIFVTFKNALTPEPTKVRTILEEYANKTKDGLWRLLPQVETRVREHSLMIGYLAEIGRLLGYKVFIGLREQNDIYNNEPLSKLCDKFTLHVSKENLEHIQMIDVLWIKKDGEIENAFDVEYTTGITEALTRGSYIPTKETKRFIVIPEEREKILYKKINAPLFKDRLENYGWKFIFFKNLKEFYEFSKRKKGISIKDFEKISKVIKPEREKQENLSNFK